MKKIVSVWYCGNRINKNKHFQEPQEGNIFLEVIEGNIIDEVAGAVQLTLNCMSPKYFITDTQWRFLRERFEKDIYGTGVRSTVNIPVCLRGEFGEKAVHIPKRLHLYVTCRGIE